MSDVTATRTLLDLFPVHPDILAAEQAFKDAHETKKAVRASVQASCPHENVGELWTGGYYERVCFTCGLFHKSWDGPLAKRPAFEITGEQYRSRRRFTDR